MIAAPQGEQKAAYRWPGRNERAKEVADGIRIGRHGDKTGTATQSG